MIVTTRVCVGANCMLVFRGQRVQTWSKLLEQYQNVVMTVLSSQLLTRGLPWIATKAHVSLFLLSHGLDAREDSIEMMCTKRSPNGRAIVYCDSNRKAMKAALAIHLTKFGYRHIEAYVHTDVDQIFALQGVKLNCSFT